MQSRIVAGDTLKPATVTLADYPADDGWVLSYRLTPRTAGSAIDFNAAASGSDHQVEVAAATTGGWVAGDYTCAAWVTKAAERYSVPSEGGQVQIAPNPATLTAGTDTRSSAEVTLAAVQDVIRNRATSGYLEVNVAGRVLRSFTLPELFGLERQLKAQVNAEDVAAGREPRYSTGRVRRILTRLS
jgi:hypothetical protein